MAWSYVPELFQLGGQMWQMGNQTFNRKLDRSGETSRFNADLAERQEARKQAVKERKKAQKKADKGIFGLGKVGDLVITEGISAGVDLAAGAAPLGGESVDIGSQAPPLDDSIANLDVGDASSTITPDVSSEVSTNVTPQAPVSGGEFGTPFAGSGGTQELTPYGVQSGGTLQNAPGTFPNQGMSVGPENAVPQTSVAELPRAYDPNTFPNEPTRLGGIRSSNYVPGAPSGLALTADQIAKSGGHRKYAFGDTRGESMGRALLGGFIGRHGGPGVSQQYFQATNPMGARSITNLRPPGLESDSHAPRIAGSPGP